jgi:type IV pilus assembly protein PilM
MTQWNPLNLFSSSRRPGGGAPSSGFDPSTTGDPVGPGYVVPAIGVGVEGERYPVYDDRPRHPIGFAPPEDRPETRYRTEISFKRHHEMPRASAESGTPDDTTPAVWETPANAGADEPASEGPAVLPSDEAVDDQEAKIPFYKREISFRRKRPVSEATLADSDEQGLAANEENAPVSEEVLPEPAQPQAAIVEPAEIEPAAKPAEAPDSLEPAAHPAPDASAEPSAPVATTVAALEAIDADEPSVDGPEPPEAFAEMDVPSDPEQEPSVAAPAAHAPIEDVAAEPTGTDAAPAETVDDPAQQPVVTPAKRGLVRSGGRKRAGKPEGGKRSRGKGRQVVGLKIGASQLAAAVVVETDSGRELVQLARRPLEPGIVVDGEVRDREALTSALKDFFQSEELPRREVRLGLGSNRIGVRIIDIAATDDEARFDNAVRFKAHEVLPVAVNESVLDYRVLEERLNESGELMRRVLLVVAPRDQVQPYAEVIDKAGLGLLGIDLEALGLLRAFVETVPAGGRNDDDSATVVVAIGHESSTLLVASRGTCEFTRVFDWGGGVLQDAIAQELGVPAVEAATILRHISLAGPGRKLDGLEDGPRASAVSAVRSRLTPFARELVNSVQFYQSQPDSLGIGGIVITGGTSQLEGLEGELHRIIGVDVTVGDPLTRVSVRDGSLAGFEGSVGSLAVPIGLAISDLATRSVDVSSTRGGKKQQTRRSTLLAIGAPVAVAVPLIALGAVYFGAHGTVASHQSELDAVDAQIAALPRPTGPTLDPALAGIDGQRAQGVANILGGRIAWEQMFRDVSRVLPENVWLTAMTATAPAEVASPAASPSAAPTAQAAATDVTITGATFTQTDVARLLARLATLPSLSSVTLVSSTAQQAKGQKQTVQFNIVASLNTSGGGTS